MVIALTVLAAGIVATGEALQQRLAAQAPPQHNLSPRLLLWLVQRPRWLAGVGCSFAGNLAFAAALSAGSVILVEAVFVVRLVFGLVIAALWRRHQVPARDVFGAVAIAMGLAAFLITAQPNKGVGDVTDTAWAIGIATYVVVACLLAAAGRQLSNARRALLLGAGAGILFGLQAALIRSAVHILTEEGVVTLLAGWHPYAVVAVALLGMLLVQSAFESAPLAASYPAVVAMQLLGAAAIAVWVLGGSIIVDALTVVVVVPAGAALLVGIYVLTTSPLVTGSRLGDAQ